MGRQTNIVFEDKLLRITVNFVFVHAFKRTILKYFRRIFIPSGEYSFSAQDGL